MRGRLYYLLGPSRVGRVWGWVKLHSSMGARLEGVPQPPPSQPPPPPPPPSSPPVALPPVGSTGANLPQPELTSGQVIENLIAHVNWQRQVMANQKQVMAEAGDR